MIENDALMCTLLHGLKKFASTSLVACIKTVSIFERMSFFQGFADRLASLKVGATSLSLLHAQLALSGVAAGSLDPAQAIAYLKSHDHLLRLIVSLLLNLAESPRAIRKMVNRDALSPILQLLRRLHSELVVLCLRFVRKVAEMHWDDVDIPAAAIIPALAWAKVPRPDRRRHHISVLKETIELLLALPLTDFDFNTLTELANFPELAQGIVRLLYHHYVAGHATTEIESEPIIEVVVADATANGGHAIALIEALSAAPKTAALIAKSPRFTRQNLRQMIVDGTLFLGLVRNIARARPALISAFDADLVAACLRNDLKEDVLVNLFGIMNCIKMSDDRARYFVAQKVLVRLCVAALRNSTASAQLQLEIVMFVAAVATGPEVVMLLADAGLPELVVRVFVENAGDLDV
jgi:hypothetical protein